MDALPLARLLRSWLPAVISLAMDHRGGGGSEQGDHRYIGGDVTGPTEEVPREH